MEKKLQIFISSTYHDLLSERQAAVEAILSAGHIPAGMELFSAGDESQLEVIRRWIDDSDIFMLILGGRFGTIHQNTGKSYIELEYEYALDKKKPVFAVVISEPALDKKIKEQGKCVLELDRPDNYHEFKKRVMSKICKFFDDEKDIKLSIHATLNDFKKRYDFSGWVSGRATENINKLISQNTTLTNENEKLRKEIELLKTKNKQLDKTINGIKYEDIEKALGNEVIKIDDNESGESIETNAFEAFIAYQDKFAVGISNKYGMNDFDRLLFYKLAPKLMTFGLVESHKVAGVAWVKLKTSKDGFQLLAQNKMRQLS